jgi:hypothetical protein
VLQHLLQLGIAWVAVQLVHPTVLVTLCKYLAV